MAQLRQKEKQFQRLGARVVLVGLGTPKETAAFKAQFNVPFPMISDSEKLIFSAFHLKQTSVGSLLSLGMAMKGLSAMVRGHRMGIHKGDVRQLPGVFIIDSFRPSMRLALGRKDLSSLLWQRMLGKQDGAESN